VDKEVLIITTNTFFTPLLGTLIHPNVVHLVYDLYPEAMIHAGIWTKNSIQTRVVRFIFRNTLNRVKANVFLGLRLKLYAESIYGPIRNPYIIGVGADETLFKYSPKIRLKKEHKSSPIGRSGVEFLYCGNFGRMHDSETLFHLWRNLENKMIRSEPLFTGFNQINFSFFCSGPKFHELINAVKALPRQISERIFINAGLSLEKWIYVMKTAEVALITMAPGAQSVVMPSKTYSAMMAGQAILAIAPEDSDLVDLVKEAECGWWIVPGDYENLEGVLEKIVNNKGDLNAKRERAYHFAHTHFTQKVLSKKWSHTLQEVISI
jgi:glycosyltransferase involved in cell wall biosynthesis